MHKLNKAQIAARKRSYTIIAVCLMLFCISISFFWIQETAEQQETVGQQETIEQNEAEQLHAASVGSPCSVSRGKATIVGTQDDDVLRGTPGDDVIYAYGGNDTLYGLGGNDILCGGHGDDVLYGHGGNDFISGDGGNDIISGGNGDDTLEGGNGADKIDGNSGQDTLYGYGDNDILRGGPGDDTLFGGASDDTLYGQAGNDVLHGAPGDDHLFGGTGNDMLYGNNGQDTLDGEQGKDTQDGGFGDDTCKYDVSDVASYQCTTSEDTNTSTVPKLILFVMLDDADYHDIGYNSVDAVTPNIDALAKDGIRLQHYYAASGICSPTRISTFTGHGPAHFGLNRLWPDVKTIINEQLYWNLRGISENTPFITDIKQAGYKTFHIGKWHIGKSKHEFTPVGKGFDNAIIQKFKPIEGTMLVEENNVHYETSSSHSWRPAYQVDKIIEAVDAHSNKHPLFVSWWPIEPHSPLYVPPTFSADENTNCCNFDLTTNRGKLLSVMYAWDKEFGRLVSHLKQTGLYEDTLIVFTSDNGGYKYALSPQREVSSTKNSLSEGGIRVPFVATWPGRIPANTVSNAVVTSTDILPTIFSFAHAAIPPGLEGIDASQILLGKQSTNQTPRYFQLRVDAWRRSTDDRASDTFALRNGCYKMLKRERTHALQLYNICTDSKEELDLRRTKPSLFRSMAALLYEHRRNKTLYASYDNVSQTVTIPHDERLNIHHDDLSFYTTVHTNDLARNGTVNLYKRGNGISFSLNKETGEVVLTLKGTATKSSNPPEKTITLQGNIPVDTQAHQIGFVLHGYLRASLVAELYIDGALVDTIGPNIDDVDTAGDSLFAILSEKTTASIGNNSLPLLNTFVYVTALRPDELVGVAACTSGIKSGAPGGT